MFETIDLPNKYRHNCATYVHRTFQWLQDFQEHSQNESIFAEDDYAILLVAKKPLLIINDKSR